MRLLNSTIAFLFATISSFSQSTKANPDSLIKTFLFDFSDRRHFRLVSYFDTLDHSTLIELKKSVKDKEFSIKSNKIKLTANEVNQINSELESLDLAWLNANFEKIMLAGPNSKTDISSGLSYKFSKPIFLRDNALCLFYYTVACPACVERKFSFYRKRKGKWREYVNIFLRQS